MHLEKIGKSMVFILVNKSILYSQVLIDSSCKIVWVQLRMQNNPNTILGSFYCLPHSPTSTWEELSDCI